MPANPSADSLSCISMTSLSVGPPTQPQPILQLVNETTLLLEWSEPYSPPDHNITNYLLAINGTSGDALCPTDDTLCNISFSRDFNKYFIQSDKHPFRDYFEQSMCALLKFQVVAVSDIGCSQAGSAEGGFPMSELLLSQSIIIIIIYCD